MPTLPNDEHERFATAVAAGRSRSDAARLAGFQGRDPRKRAFDLLQRDDIKARIAELETDREAAAATAAAMATQVQQAEEEAKGHDPASLEWFTAEHRRNLAISKARGDTRETRATLIELADLHGLKVQRSEVTTRSDALPLLTGPELAALRSVITALRQQPIIIDGVAEPAAVLGAPDAR